MTVSMRVMSAGDGYKYLLHTVAAADGDRSLSTSLTRYYQAKGTPPGRWMGGGVRGLGDGRIVEGAEVTEPQLQLLIGMGRDPVSGEPLGRAYPVYQSAAERAAAEAEGGADDIGPTGRAASCGSDLQDESSTGRRRPVAGYDFTFSIPKSASILWGIADAHTQTIIARAHHAAVDEVLAFMEREVAATRAGAIAGDGAIAQVDVTGLVATAFDHFDSRAGDPHLHTHVVISNKVQTVLDGKWRSLDGRPMHAAVVALSELHEALFADALTRALGVEWEMRARGNDRNPAWAIRSVPDALVAEFSTRSRHIDTETDRLIDAYVRAHSHRPNPTTITKLRSRATLSTRPGKEVHSLAELTAEWREQAARVLGEDSTVWASVASARRPVPLMRAEDVSLDVIGAIGQSVMTAVSEKRSTWRHWNLAAESARQTMHFRFAAASDREAIGGLIVDAAEQASLQLTPPEFATSPAAFRRDDGTSVFRPKHSIVFTSHELLDAEARLLERAADETGPRIPLTALRSTESQTFAGGLGDDQTAALTAVAGSGRVLEVLVGPAGAGKTTAMNAIRCAWERERGVGSVIGLAPSAAAANVLAGDIGIATENLAKWWQNHLNDGDAFEAGQLVIIDEASLASTLQLDRITALAAASGAKVLLVGDYAQLQSVDAGGAFSLLVHDRPDAPALVGVHRFVHEWEKAASLGLRHGNPEVIDQYLAHDRVRDGSTEAMTDAAYVAWRADARAGRSTVLISDSNEAVAALNLRARTDGILDGRVDALREVALHDGTAASVGDTVTTRRNDRRLRAARTWVRNGDRWAVLAVRQNGSLEVRRQGRRWGSSAVLPADYVQHHVELGYAVTSHRAQGMTTDTAHVVVAPGTTRENFYVAMTRGREANNAYVSVDRPDVAHVGPRPGDDPEASARSILFGVMQTVGAELSAHETLAAEQGAWGSIAQLAAEYETIAAAAQHDRWLSLVRESGLTPDQADVVIGSDAFGPLGAELRRAEAHHMDVNRVLPRVVRARGFDDAQDIAAVLRARVMRELVQDAGAGRARSAPQLIAGLVPMALGPMAVDMARALAERGALIEARANALVDQALGAKDAWVQALGAPPRGASSATAWHRHACTVAAYRDRYGIAGSSPLGSSPLTTSQELDAARAHAALETARRQAGHDSESRGAPTPTISAHLPSAGLQV